MVFQVHQWTGRHSPPGEADRPTAAAGFWSEEEQAGLGENIRSPHDLFEVFLQTPGPQPSDEHGQLLGCHRDPKPDQRAGEKSVAPKNEIHSQNIDYNTYLCQKPIDFSVKIVSVPKDLRF
jgi:hypothetical protein